MLEFICGFIDEFHMAPTFKEMCIGLGWGSTNTVEYHLTRLEAAGLIQRKRYSPRAIWSVKHE